MREILLFVALIGTSASSFGSSCEEKPAAIAEYIFKNAIEFYTYKKNAPEFVSSELGRLLERDWKCQEPGELCALDTYPWTQTQDGEVLEPVLFSEKAIQLDRAFVEMTYTFGWADIQTGRETRRNSLSFVREGASRCWRLDDISSGEWSLKGALANWPHYED